MQISHISRTNTTQGRAFLHADNTSQATPLIHQLKLFIWLYIILLIFEGALRKWLLPSLSSQILLIRDPIALLIIFYAWRADITTIQELVLPVVAIGLFSIMYSVFFQNGNILVALYGARPFVVHFPMAFILGKVFTRKDVVKVGLVFLWISIPMTILIILQFYSPQSAFVNRGVGGNTEGAGFSGALGYLRPPGTFSFTNGVTLFYSILGGFVFYFWFAHHSINRLLLLLASTSLIVAIPISISRGLLFQVSISFVFLLISLLKQPNGLKKIIPLIAVSGASFLIILKLPFLTDSLEAFFVRFSAASTAEGGLRGTLIDRFLGELLSSFFNAFELPPLGLGSGTGTIAGSQLLTGKSQFLIAENEWGRIIGELGLFLGSVVIFIRFKIAYVISVVSFRQLQSGESLGWMIASFASIIVLQGGWAQATSLGFFTLSLGLSLAVLKSAKIRN